MTADRVLGAAVVILVAAATLPACREQRRDLPSPDAPVILFFGDSITRGQGIQESQAFPALIQQRLSARGLDYLCINAGVSGDTTASALARIEPYVSASPAIVLVELGANDWMRGISRLRTKSNLEQIVRRFSDAGARVILVGTQFPHIQHPAYLLSMDRVFEQVATEAGAELIHDLLAGVAGVRELNLADGIHPNPQGHARLAEIAWPLILGATGG